MKEILFIGWKKCSTVRKAMKYLDDHNLEYEFKDIMDDTPNKEELKTYLDKSGLDIRRFFNTSGMVYRELNLKDKLDAMSEDEKLSLLASNGKLIKRPILVKGDTVFVGFKEKEYETLR